MHSFSAVCPHCNWPNEIVASDLPPRDYAVHCSHCRATLGIWSASGLKLNPPHAQASSIKPDRAI